MTSLPAFLRSLSWLVWWACRWEGSYLFFFFFKQKTAYDIGLGIPAEPLFRSRRTLFHVLVGCGLLMLKVSRLKLPVIWLLVSMWLNTLTKSQIWTLLLKV